MSTKNIRNFCIIAHIDHGKSTLADRLLELTATIEARHMRAQVLDQMDLERERGITIKMQPVRMVYRPAEIQNPKSKILNKSKIQNSNKLNKSLEFRISNLGFADSEFILNLIDTPGHVDFQYEVSRSLAAVEGALLVVDAAQGIQAQTIANLHLAMAQDLTIIPVINKIDMPAADVEKTSREIISLLGCKPDEIIKISAKTGEGVEQILRRIIEDIPAPAAQAGSALQALIFDSIYDDYQGVVAYIRVMRGEITRGDKVQLIGTQAQPDVLEVGVFKPKREKKDKLCAGEIGYVVTGLKDLRAVRVGDTVTSSKLKTPASPALSADRPAGGQNARLKELKLAGYQEVKPMVFAGLYPRNTEDFEQLREAMEKIHLNDASFSFEPERSDALGPGFRAGFLGLLHLDIIRERISREFNLQIIVTTPSVEYRVEKTSGQEIMIRRPQELPDQTAIKQIAEPWVQLEVVTPAEFLGGLMGLIQERRGEYISTDYLEETRAVLYYRIPLSSILTDFYDKLKGASRGYASLAWEFHDWRPAKIIRLDVLIAEQKEEALAQLVYEPDAYRVGRQIVERLKELMPKQMFVVKLQAVIGGKVIAAERLSALRKDVTAKLYGGDVTRKRKLLEKQKKGKKKLMAQGKVEIPSSVYLDILKQ